MAWSSNGGGALRGLRVFLVQIGDHEPIARTLGALGADVRGVRASVVRAAGLSLRHFVRRGPDGRGGQIAV